MIETHEQPSICVANGSEFPTRIAEKRPSRPFISHAWPRPQPAGLQGRTPLFQAERSFTLSKEINDEPPDAIAFAMTGTADERLSFAEVRAARDRQDCEAQERELPSENHD